MRRDTALTPSRTALPLVVLGLAFTMASGTIARTALAGAEARVDESATTALPPPQPAGPGPLLLRGPGDVAVVTVVYEPAQSSGWHAHSGLEAVAVLSGELTVYDRDCRPQRVAPGAPYVGGQELHLVRNETPQPVEMIVTHLNAATLSPADAVRPNAPAGCAVR